MFQTPEPLRRERNRVLNEVRVSDTDAEEAGRRLLAVDPDFPPGLLALGGARMEAKDFDAAEPLLWRALAGAPCNPGYYLPLAALYRERGDSLMSDALAGLSMWQMSLYGEIPKGLIEAVQSHAPDLGEDASNPGLYESLALDADKQFENRPWPSRLAAHRILARIQHQSEGGLPPELVEETIANGPACAPLFVAAVREAADSDNSSLSIPAEALLLALLGEIGGPELIDGLLELGGDDEDVFLHAQWAVFRLGQRNPQAAFERLCGLAAAAEPAVRAAIAEHLYFLRELPDARRAILGLLDGFNRFGNDEMAALLLMTVSTLMAMMDSPADSLEVIKRHERRLSKHGRELLNGMMTSEEPFVPELINYGVDEASTEAVCCDLALMATEDDEEHEHDHEHEFDEDFEEDAGFDDLPPVPKPGRNDPCWCGSGKKYKKCHLEADEQQEREAPERDREADLFKTMWEALLEASRQYHRRADVGEAFRLYFDQTPDEVDHEEVPDTGFFEWFLLDFKAPSMRRAVAAEFLRRHGPRLADEARELVQSWLDNRVALWEVQRIERGKGVEVKDVFEGDTIFVDDVSTSDTVNRWDCIISRAHRWRGQWLFLGNGFFVPRPLVGAVREAVEAGRRKEGTTAGEFFRAHSHQWRRFVLEEHAERLEGLRVVNADGDPLEFCSAEYELSDADAVASALAADAELPALGSVAIDAAKLRLECNSRRRLELGRKRIEERCGELVRHLGDTFESLDEVKRRALEAPAEPDARKIDPELEREVILEFKAKHYGTWPDLPVPALGGKTPREAVRTTEGRGAVENLLRDFENAEDRERRAGRPAFDFSGLRANLGL